MLRKLAAVTSVGFLVLLTLPALVLAAAGGELSQQEPTQHALADIPPDYLTLYQDATARRCPTLPWYVLAAIGKVESDHGRLGGARLHPDGTVTPPIIGVALDGSPGVARILDTDRGRYDGDPIYDRAVGPMQFIPSTWPAYGIDASGSGTADPHNAVDAIHAAARYLCENGASDPQQIPRAILAYNRSTTYRVRVLEIASDYATAGGGASTASPTLTSMVLANPRLDIYPAGRDDIAAGRIDARVLTVLQQLSQLHTLTIVSLKTGHSRCIGGGDYQGCRVSQHWHGRAVDIAAIDGAPVNRGNLTARAIAERLHGLPPPLRPSEAGTPWHDLTPLPGFFSDAAHTRHLHLGWSAD
jgi:hypothetical protein